MKITFQPADPFTITADALVVPVPSGATATIADRLPPAADDRRATVTTILSDAAFDGAAGKTQLIVTTGMQPARRIIFAGTGALGDIEGTRQGYAAAALAVRQAGCRTVVLALPDDGDAMSELEAATEAVGLALYRFTSYYGTAHSDDDRPDPASLIVASTTVSDAEANVALDRAATIVTATNLARDLVNEPANVLDPAMMAERASAVADATGLEYGEIGVTQLAEMGAGAILAVGRGSTTEPRLIHLVYRPPTEIASGRRIGLVGKCITFDTGGYSIKTGDGMVTMKIDMGGGASVLGAMSALTALRCPHEVHGVICAAENMISGDAFRPGDILTASNGVTIEVISTDAEGRLVLADGLVYAARQGAEELIDLATLTGAAIVALGESTAAVFASDDTLATRLLDAARTAGENMWRMPLTPALHRQIRSDVGDIKNTGGRPGGAITAALFLDHFREGLPWAHIDLAGPAHASRATGYIPKGGTGFGVRSLLAYLTTTPTA